MVADDKLRDEFDRHDCTHRHRVTVWVFWFEQRFRTRGEGKRDVEESVDAKSKHEVFVLVQSVSVRVERFMV